MQWQFGAWETDSLSAYVGLDIVTPVIELNTARYAHHSNKVFSLWDFAACSLPKIKWAEEAIPRSAELVHARHVLQHMPLKRAAAAARNMVESGARILLVSTSKMTPDEPSKRSVRGPINVAEGMMWFNDMEKAPFDFPPPFSCSGKGMCAYEFDEASRDRWLSEHPVYRAAVSR